MFEYRLIFHWDAEHWTCICAGDMPVDIDQYIDKHLAEMQEAVITGEEYFSVIQCYSGKPFCKWQGSLEELCVYVRDMTDSWLDRAFT